MLPCNEMHPEGLDCAEMDGINAAIAMAAAKLNNILAYPKRNGSDKGGGEDKKKKEGVKLLRLHEIRSLLEFREIFLVEQRQKRAPKEKKVPKAFKLG